MTKKIKKQTQTSNISEIKIAVPTTDAVITPLNPQADNDTARAVDVCPIQTKCTLAFDTFN